LLMVMDHVTAAWPSDGNRDRLVLTNPTEFAAEVTVMWDEKPMSTRLNPDEWLRVHVAAHQNVTVFLPKNDSDTAPTFNKRKVHRKTADFVAK